MSLENKTNGHSDEAKTNRVENTANSIEGSLPPSPYGTKDTYEHIPNYEKQKAFEAMWNLNPDEIDLLTSDYLKGREDPDSMTSLGGISMWQLAKLKVIKKQIEKTLSHRISNNDLVDFVWDDKGFVGNLKDDFRKHEETLKELHGNVKELHDVANKIKDKKASATNNFNDLITTLGKDKADILYKLNEINESQLTNSQNTGSLILTSTLIENQLKEFKEQYSTNHQELQESYQTILSDLEFAKEIVNTMNDRFSTLEENITRELHNTRDQHSAGLMHISQEMQIEHSELYEQAKQNHKKSTTERNQLIDQLLHNNGELHNHKELLLRIFSLTDSLEKKAEVSENYSNQIIEKLIESNRTLGNYKPLLIKIFDLTYSLNKRKDYSKENNDLLFKYKDLLQELNTKLNEKPKEVIVEKVVEVPKETIIEKTIEVPKEVIVKKSNKGLWAALVGAGIIAVSSLAYAVFGGSDNSNPKLEKENKRLVGLLEKKDLKLKEKESRLKELEKADSKYSENLLYIKEVKDDYNTKFKTLKSNHKKEKDSLEAIIKVNNTTIINLTNQNTTLLANNTRYREQVESLTTQIATLSEVKGKYDSESKKKVLSKEDLEKISNLEKEKLRLEGLIATNKATYDANVIKAQNIEKKAYDKKLEKLNNNYTDKIFELKEKLSKKDKRLEHALLKEFFYESKVAVIDNLSEQASNYIILKNNYCKDIALISGKKKWQKKAEANKSTRHFILNYLVKGEYEKAFKNETPSEKYSKARNLYHRILEKSFLEYNKSQANSFKELRKHMSEKEYLDSVKSYLNAYLKGKSKKVLQIDSFKIDKLDGEIDQVQIK